MNESRKEKSSVLCSSFSNTIDLVVLLQGGKSL